MNRNLKQNYSNQYSSNLGNGLNQSIDNNGDIPIEVQSYKNISKNFIKLLTKYFMPNPLSFLFFPSDSDIADIKETEKTIEIERSIFGGQINLSKFEIIKIFKFKAFILMELFHKFLKETNFNLDDYLFFIFSDILKFEKFPICVNVLANESFRSFIDYLANYFTNMIQNKNNNQTEKSKTISFVEIDDAEILRFLTSNDFKFLNTLCEINSLSKWKKENLPIKIISNLNSNKKYKLNDNIDFILSTGFMYIHGFDKQFRPNIIIKPEIYFTNNSNKKFKFEFKDWLGSALFILEFCINFLFIPGQVENWNLIIDLNNVSVYSLPNELTEILQVIQKNYKYRLHKIYILNLNFMTNMLWKMVKSIIIKDYMNKKFKVISCENNFGELFNDISRTQIEIKYGGYAENKTFNTLEIFKIKNEYDIQGVIHEKYYKDSVINIEKNEIKFEIYSIIQACYEKSIQDFKFEKLFQENNDCNNNYTLNNEIIYDNYNSSMYFIKNKKFIKKKLKEFIDNRFIEDEKFIENKNNISYLEEALDRIKKSFLINLKFFHPCDLIEEDNSNEKILIKEEEYELRIKNNDKIFKSPYFSFCKPLQEIKPKEIFIEKSPSTKSKSNLDLIQSRNFGSYASSLFKNSVSNEEKKNFHEKKYENSCENSINLYESCIDEKNYYERNTNNRIEFKNPDKIYSNNFENINKDKANNDDTIILNLEMTKLNKNKNKNVVISKSQKHKNKHISKNHNYNKFSLISEKEKNSIEDSKFCKVECGMVKMQCNIF